MDNNIVFDKNTEPEVQTVFDRTEHEIQSEGNVVMPPQSTPKPKRKKWPILLLIVVIVLALAGVAVFLIIQGNKDDSISSSESPKSGQLREQEFLNEKLASTDTMSVILKTEEMGETYTVFIGFNLENVSKDLTFDSFSDLYNESVRILEYLPMGVSFEFGERNFYDFSLSIPLIYRPGSASKKASINNNEIVYNEGNYYAVYNDVLNDYYAYYKYGTIYEDGLADGEESWLLVEFDIYDTQEEAIARIKKLADTSLICAFTEGDIKSNCEGYQNYNNLNDILLKELNKRDIFVSSYKNIRSMTSSIDVLDDSGKTRISISYFDADESDFKEGYSEFEMDGRKYYYRDFTGFGTIYEPIDGKVIGYTIILPDDIDKTSDNVIRIFRDTFSRTE